MNRELIEEIIAKVGADLPEFKKVALYNNDFDKQNDGTKSGLNFPALFISFPQSIEYQDGTSGVQRSDDFVVRFYIGEKFATDKDVLDIFDLKQKVYTVFNGWKPSKASTFRRRSEETDEDRGGFYVFAQDYVTNLIDDETFVEKSRIPVTLNELIINPTLNP